MLSALSYRLGERSRALFARQPALVAAFNASARSSVGAASVAARRVAMKALVQTCVRHGPAALYRVNTRAAFSSKPPDAESPSSSSSSASSSSSPPPPAAAGNSSEPPAAATSATNKNETVKDLDRFNDDEYDDYEEPKTAGQKVRLYWILFMRLSLLALGVVCVAYTAYELFPRRDSPNNLFSEVFDILRIHDDVKEVTGEPLTAFGRDFGRNTEGRRNHVDSRKYKAEDGSNRTRVRFNVKGPKGQFQVWVEVSDRMLNTEFVYLIVQDVRSGRVITLQDNRERLEQEYLASGLAGGEGDGVIASLLGGLGMKK